MSLSSTSSNSLFESADLLSLLHSLQLFDQVLKNPLLSFLGLFTHRYVLNNLNSYDRVLIVKGLGHWLSGQLNQANEKQPPADDHLHPPSHLSRYCELYLLIVSQLISWESLSSSRSVASITWYDITAPDSQKEGQLDDFRTVSSLQSNDKRGWHLKHRVGWLKIPVTSLSFALPSSFSSLSSFFNQLALNTFDPFFLSSLSDDNSMEILRYSNPKVFEMIVFLHALSTIHPSVSFSRLDPSLFQLILSLLRMDMFPQLIHEMMHLCLLLLISAPVNEEYHLLFEWLCASPSSKRKSGETPPKSCKKVRCEISPSRTSSPMDNESHLLRARKEFASPKKLVFHTPLKRNMAPPHQMKSSSPSNSETNSGIAFTSPTGKDESFYASGPSIAEKYSHFL